MGKTTYRIIGATELHATYDNSQRAPPPRHQCWLTHQPYLLHTIFRVSPTHRPITSLAHSLSLIPAAHLADLSQVHTPSLCYITFYLYQIAVLMTLEIIPFRLDLSRDSFNWINCADVQFLPPSSSRLSTQFSLCLPVDLLLSMLFVRVSCSLVWRRGTWPRKVSVGLLLFRAKIYECELS